MMRVSLRVLFALLLFVFLAGPTPGAIGSCDGEAGDEFADLTEYCLEKEKWICVRQFTRQQAACEDEENVARCRIDNNAQMQTCRYDSMDICNARSWASNCRPTVRQADACINALSSTQTLDTPVDEIKECDPKRLCTVLTAPQPGVDGGM